MNRDVLIAGIIVLCAPLAFVAGLVLVGSDDAFLAAAFGGTGVFLFVVMAITVLISGRRGHTSGLALRTNQQVSLEPGWLTYSFRISGDRNAYARNVIVARLESPVTQVGYDALGRISLSGGVWRFADLDVSHPYTRMLRTDTGTKIPPSGGRIPPVNQLEHVGSFSLPDAFVPDVMQAILANYVSAMR